MAQLRQSPTLLQSRNDYRDLQISFRHSQIVNSLILLQYCSRFMFDNHSMLTGKILLYVVDTLYGSRDESECLMIISRKVRMAAYRENSL